MRTGVADLPLHDGRCPTWLFPRMVKLSKLVSQIIIEEYGKNEFLRRLSDPLFFQAFGCLVGFDFHSSGLTTTLTGALKEAKLEEFGISVLGGKGKASRKVPQEIESLSEKFSLSTKEIEKLKYASRMSAKVDSVAVQDGYTLYHHAFIVTEDGKWSVIQQGMNLENNYARRYHWLSEKVVSFVNEPHLAICCDVTGKTLNMVAKENEEVRKASVDLVNDNPEHLKKYFVSYARSTNLFKYLHMSSQHHIELKNYETLIKVHEIQPKKFEELLAIKGVGVKTVRALALCSELIFGTEISWRDPVKFSFAHGGKDGYPYRIKTRQYDKTIQILSDAIRNAQLNNREKLEAIRRLSNLFS
ncbi:MAG: DUF763 domain-containing protein [Candidatus Aenigmatarchaeota archaeon]|nr:DUF763 domain-containing protein [Candidatus Aenigmarchaeota archaeon]